MTRTWTGPELDDALAELTDVLDRDGGGDDATLAAVRHRLGSAVPVPGPVPAAAASDPVDVVEVGAVPADGPVGRRRRLVPGLLLVAVLVAAVAVAVVVWRGGGPRSTAPAQPSPSATSAADRVRQRLAVLPRPLPSAPDSAVLFETSGSGDAAFGDAFAVTAPRNGDAGGVRLTYAFVCSDPRAGSTRPGGGSRYTVTDNLGWVVSGSCSAPGQFVSADDTDALGPPTAAGRTGVSVSVADADVVWRLVVAVTAG